MRLLSMCLMTVANFRITATRAMLAPRRRLRRLNHSRSLANYWGLTPGCRNSGESNQRLGSITKAGSSMARWLLAEVTIKVLRRDARLREWFKRLKRRRGASIARVAVMRKLATVIWHMLSKRKTYAACRAAASRSHLELAQTGGISSCRKAAQIEQPNRSVVPSISSLLCPVRQPLRGTYNALGLGGG